MDNPGGERRWIAALLVITVAMGMLDAVSLLHLGTFTGYMTGALLLMGIDVAQGAAIATPPLFALAGLLIGAVAGGRLVRRRHPPPRLVSDLLVAVAVLVGLAALLKGLVPAEDRAVIAILGFAMGLQTSATRHAGVADMALPAATMVLHGLAHDSRLAGGSADRVGRRIGVILGLFVGAAGGALLAARHVWLGLAGTAVLIFLAGVVLRAPFTKGRL